MKSTKTNARRKPEGASTSRPPIRETDLFLPRNPKAREWVLEREREARRVEIFLDHFSAEQRVQIDRLASDLFEAGASGLVEDTIATLAEAALFVFGLDPIARDAFDKVSSVVYGDGSADEYLINVLINERAGEKWTANRRAAERERALKGRAA